MLGTNGGGFFNANSAHPFENPSALTNLIQILLIFSLGAGLTNVFGRMVGNQRQGWAIFAVMFVLFFTGVVTKYWAGSWRGQPGVRRAARRSDRERVAGRRQHGRQGSAVRHRQLGVVHHHHD